MKIVSRIVCVMLFVSALIVGASSQTLVWGGKPAMKMKIVCNHPDGLYGCGEIAAVSIEVTRDGKQLDEGEISYRVATHGGNVLISEGKVAVKNGSAAFNISRDTPGFIICTITCTAVDGVSIGQKAGIGFDVDQIQPAVTMPDDFEAFWASARKERDAIPLDLRLTRCKDVSDKKFEVFKFSMANINSTRTYGYLTVPKGGKGPFPAWVMVPSAGPGLRKPFYPILAKEGVLCLSVNVHAYDILPYDGDPVDMTKVYNGNYGHQGAPDPKAYYFYRAILGVDRAIDYLASRPDWDGKHLAMKGASQGGAFTLILTGLNRHITAAAASIPGLCDQAGYLVGHGSAWPSLIPLRVRNKNDATEKEWLRFVSYFDVVNFARSIKCPVMISVGLKDMTGKAGPAFAAFNQIKSPKRAFTDPTRGHSAVLAYSSYVTEWTRGQLGLSKLVPPCNQPLEE